MDLARSRFGDKDCRIRFLIASDYLLFQVLRLKGSGTEIERHGRITLQALCLVALVFYRNGNFLRFEAQFAAQLVGSQIEVSTNKSLEISGLARNSLISGCGRKDANPLMLIKSITTMDFMAYFPAMNVLQKGFDERDAASRNAGGQKPWLASICSSHFGKPSPQASVIQVPLI
jgi:hypothetical protein